MSKISAYPDGGLIQSADKLIVARSGANKSIPGSALFGYTLPFGWSGFSPNDSTTYYAGARYTIVMSTAITGMKIYVPKTGAIKAIYAEISGVAGSAELSSIYLRYDDTTDTLISNALNLSTLPLYFNNTALNIAVVAGHYVSLKWITPAWVTNPTGLDVNGTIYIE